MKKSVIQCIILLFFTFNFAESQTLKPILKLDSSKTYEFYIEDIGYHEPKMRIIKRNEDGYPERFTGDSIIIYEDSNKEDNYYSKLFYSRKTGMYIIIYNKNNFILNDQKTIKKIEKEWIGEYTDVQGCGCPADYIVKIVENDKIVENLSITHGNVILESGIIECKVKPFDSLDKSRKFFIAKISFNSDEQSRYFIEDARKINGIYVKSPKNWLCYDGSFYLKFNNKGDNKIVERIRREIKRQYPDENVDANISEWADNKYVLIEIYCNKSLADAFSKYKIYKVWEPIVLKETEIFFKDHSQIQGLIDKYIND